MALFEEEQHIVIAGILKDLWNVGWIDISVIEAFVLKFSGDNELFKEDKFRQYIYGEE